MSHELPKISVALPVHADNPFLHQAVFSILEQSFQDFELLIIANNVSDLLWEKLQGFGADKRVRLFRNDLKGLSFNLNFALNIARASYFARMDSDDVSLPQRLQKQFDYLEAHPEISVLGTGYETIDQQGQKISKENYLHRNDQDFQKSLIRECGIAHPTIMARRKDIMECGGYSWGEFAEDYDLWIRMQRQGYHFENLDESLLQYRIHSGQSSNVTNARRNRAYVASLKFREFLMTRKAVALDAILYDLFGEQSFKYKTLRVIVKVLQLFLR